MHVEKITIRNFRCFAQAEASLNHSGREVPEGETKPRLENVNLFLGNNGAGKSSVFQAVALSVLSPVTMNSGFKPDYLVRRKIKGKLDSDVSNQAQIRSELRLNHTDVEFPSGEESATVSRGTGIVRQGDYEVVTSDTDHNYQAWSRLFLDDSPAFFIVGYGANRRTERPEGYNEQNRSPRYQRVASLFESHVGLVPFSTAFNEFYALDSLDEARKLLNGLLPFEVRLQEETNARATSLFHVRGADVPFNALSDGYRTFIGWVWDLLLRLARVEPNQTPLTEVQGVVIMDEIDLFLHPEWQRLVVEQVAMTFPNLQFLFSTHSPLIAGTLEARNIFVMDTDDNGAATIEQYDENVYGLSASQVLTSSYFGLHSTRAPHTGDLSDLAERTVSSSSIAIRDLVEQVRQGIKAK